MVQWKLFVNNKIEITPYLSKPRIQPLQCSKFSSNLDKKSIKFQCYASAVSKILALKMKTNWILNSPA